MRENCRRLILQSVLYSGVLYERKKEKGTARGFTLIELLVTMGILALLVVILNSVFTVSLRGWRKSDNLMCAAATARIVLERMSREISSAIVKSSDSFYYCVGFDATSPSGWKTDSIGDEFFFIAKLKPDNSDGSDLCEAGYWLDGRATAESRDDVLRRFYVTNSSGTVSFDYNFSTPAGKSNSDEFSESITGLRFDFYDKNNNVFSSWDSRVKAGPPAKIKITITVEEGKGSAVSNPDFISKDFSTFISFPQ
ncbi:MAG: type II secretion system protein [Candidatus Omnitrophica bacterium]|nr:type II secretion system protein [Candidatus Omnitrophota bacterium]